jgi:hypothetical protein
MVILRELALGRGLRVQRSVCGAVHHAVGERAGLCRPTS